MAIVTIDGYRGSGSTEVGIRVAEALNANYIDRLLLRKAAEKAQAPIGEFVGRAGREYHPPRGIMERMQRFLGAMGRRLLQELRLCEPLGGLRLPGSLQGD